MQYRRTERPIPIFDVKKWTGRMLVAALFAAALLYLAEPVRPAFLGAGTAVASLGLLIRIWGVGHLHKNKELATGGPYAFVRHPLYVGTFCVMVGLGLMAETPWVLYGLLPVGVVVFLVYYAPKKERVESARLAKRFGEDFERYRSAVRGYIPRVTPYPHRQGRWQLDGIFENREYLITVSVLFGFAVIYAKYLYLGQA
ncbi:MAG: methyltransferase family protein [Planctomycetota bacterium]|jgi:protein-S-isoprenylcysteine O-methyltransferase Ste14